MKLLIFVIALVTMAAAADNVKFPTFTEWKKIYNKSYATTAEETQAETTYKANCARMTIDNTKLTYQQRPNENSDLTLEQLKALQGESGRESHNDSSTIANGASGKDVKASLPASLDYRP